MALVIEQLKLQLPLSSKPAFNTKKNPKPQNHQVTIEVIRNFYSRAKPLQVVLYQALYGECSYVVLASSAKQVGSHTQSQHQDEATYQKALPLGLKSVLQDLQTSIPDPRVQKKNGMFMKLLLFRLF